MNFPDMGDAFAEWSDEVTVRRVAKFTQDHQIVERHEAAEATGLLAPLTARQIAYKPEGQRAWRWWQFITKDQLEIDEIVVDADAVQYRVASVLNYGMAGFYTYDLTEAYSRD